jgi:hypothetical protein
MRLVPIGTGFCTSFRGIKPTSCQICGQPERRHSVAVPYVFDQTLMETSEVGIACEHCFAVYAIGFDTCPNCENVPISLAGD